MVQRSLSLDFPDLSFLPVVSLSGSYYCPGTELLIWFIFTLSFNLCLGYTGLPSFGHGAFYGVGTYAAALVFLHLFRKPRAFSSPSAWEPWSGALFAGFLSAT